ncbi:uncharacterized protein A1O5_08592 [Cladophialophora psammophila CBS 110553]|uniref:Cyclohexanone monooxygenase n=1 Tax=Cladophialophora psammophila CBS 110553 TaxID=1182543 RepID=W9WJ95_9EURO|nr:uncharacterized protein A1O5_08592 [Cladophialophora psammophila CBS 110553]EXJ67978.1 hypothetical protein A1O5_08592 [Cladophialophora psammophila CBS 110553]
MYDNSAAQEACAMNGSTARALPTPLEWIHGQYGSAADSLPKPANWVPIMESPMYTPRKMRVITIGAGFSGLMVAHKIQHDYKMETYCDHVIYEKNPEAGGTWFENQYPGVACDVPAHIYTFTWAPNPKWSSYYVKGPEIRSYIQNVAKEYDLEKNVVFNAKVLSATWTEDEGKWVVEVDMGDHIKRDNADVVINASGVLNDWHWPDIPGLEKFKGHLCHSAAWDQNYDYTGKTVAVIGNGSSAIQIVPSLQPIVKHMTTFIRSATWISPNFAAEHTRDGGNFQYSEEELKEFEDPDKLLAYRKKIEHGFNKLYRGLQYGTPEHEFFQAQSRQIMVSRMEGNKDMQEKLIPTWAFGCRRLSPGDGYLEALQKPNVNAIFNSATAITADGVVDSDGAEHKVDAIICATGFDTSWAKKWPVKGRNGALLKEQWSEDPQSYLSVCAKNFPNLFFILGPNAPVGNGSLIPSMEWAGMYAVNWIRKIAREQIHSIEPKQGSVDDFNVYTQEYLKRTVYTSPCRSWYKNNKVDGPVTAMWAGSPMHFKDMMSTQRGEDFDIKYCSPNRFRFMGNGTTQRDKKDMDLSYYLRKDGWKQDLKDTEELLV